MERLRITTRKSQLALAQTRLFARSFKEVHPGALLETLPLLTTGDKLLDAPLANIGGKGVFTKELDEALLSKRADVAVHSLKDVPHTLPNGLAILAFLAREDPLDVLVSKTAKALEELPLGARVGTSSLRRRVQLLNLRDDVRIVPIRGNVGTRLKKLETQGLDALILARAGIVRLGLELDYSPIPKETIIPALGQGIIAVVGREGEVELTRALGALTDPRTTIEARCERRFVKLIGGSCQVPVAGNASLVEGKLLFQAAVGSLDGRVLLKAKASAGPESPERLADEVFEELNGQGLRPLLEDIVG
jgi:hydroxymethylbilane synthase